MNKITKFSGIIFIFILLFPSLTQAQTYPMEPSRITSLRSFDSLFPYLGENRKNEVFSENGLIRSLGKNENLELIPSPDSGIDLHRIILAKKTSYLAESLMVVPYTAKVYTRLDSYNALGKIRELKGRLYRSYTRKTEIPLFEEATRLESARKNNPIPDPPPALQLPATDTVYIRLKDVNFGNSYYRGDMSLSPYGVIYNLTNYKSLSYLFFTVMKEERFSAILYLEPLAEGMLVYSVAGADASDFIASRIDIPTAISKRLSVFIDWVGDGLKNIK